MPSMSPWSKSSRRPASQSSLADEHQIEDAGEVVQVLADVVEAHDLGRFRERRMPISGAVAATLLAVEQPSISADTVRQVCRGL